MKRAVTGEILSVYYPSVYHCPIKFHEDMIFTLPDYS